MKMTIESTTEFVSIEGLAARVWTGKTETGVKVTAFIHGVVCKSTSDQTEFGDLEKDTLPEGALRIAARTLADT